MDNIKEIALDIVELVEKKNKDYGNSFDKSIERFGDTVYLIRIEDKFNRLCNLLNPDYEVEVEDEKVEDTLRDIVGYTLLMLNRLERRIK